MAKEGTTWSVAALHRQQWRALLEGYILHRMNQALVK